MADRLVSISVATTVVAGLFSLTQWWVQTDVEERKGRFEIVKYYFANPTIFDPCRPEFLTALATLSVAYPAIVGTLRDHGIESRATRCQDPDQRKEVLNAIGTGEPAKTTNAATGAPNRFQIYIHYPTNNAGKRATAEQLQTRLREAGYTVLGIEGVSGSPSRNEIRIYRGSADQKSAASQILSALGPDQNTFKIVDISQTFPNLPPNIFEIWLER